MAVIKILAVGRVRLTVPEQRVLEVAFPNDTEFDYRFIDAASAEMPQNPEQWLMRCELEKPDVVILPQSVQPLLPIPAMERNFLHVALPAKADGSVEIRNIYIQELPFSGENLT